MSVFHNICLVSGKQVFINIYEEMISKQINEDTPNRYVAYWINFNAYLAYPKNIWPLTTSDLRRKNAPTLFKISLSNFSWSKFSDLKEVKVEKID